MNIESVRRQMVAQQVRTWEVFDPGVLAFSSLDYIQVGDPLFGGPPSINPFVPGVLESWAVGDFEGIIGDKVQPSADHGPAN